MIVYQPDPYPGRCLNLRPSRNAYGQMRRCLGNEGHEGKCQFVTERPPENLASSVGAYTNPKPEPWTPPAPEGTDGK